MTATTDATVAATTTADDELPKIRLLPGLRLLLHTVWVADPLRAVLTLVLQLVNDVGSIGVIYGAKLVLDGVTVKDTGTIVTGVALAAGVAAAQQLSAAIGGTYSVVMREKTSLAMERELLELVAAIPGLEHHERPRLLDRIELLRQDQGRFGGAVMSLVLSVVTCVQILATAVLLYRVHPALLLLPFLAYLPVRIAQIREKVWAKTEEATTGDYRLIVRLKEAALSPRAAADLRTHRLGDVVLDRHREAAERILAARRKTLVKAGLLSQLQELTLTLPQMACIGLVVWVGIEGRVTAGDVLLAIGLVLRVGWQTHLVSRNMGWLLSSLRMVSRLAWLQDEAAAAVRATTPVDPQPAPDRIERGITMRDVGLRYPGTERAVLEGVDLFLPAGSTVALVGENGAGKSTLVKLLCRFYEPTSGVVDVDGVDLRTITPEDWRSRLAGAFQDHARLELIALEAVGVGDVERVADREAVGDALDRAGARRTVERLPDGLDTELGTSFAHGRVLSGGQWQQLALGRAMMRTAPLLLVLDEPTAALDPNAEHRLFERYAAAAGAAKEVGGITLLVSHRFSTVRMADLIVVLEDGHVTAAGTHAELISRPGLYADLYTLQAASYR